VRSRRYDETFWKDLLGTEKPLTGSQSLKDLGF